jgi:hypothetical protein
LRSKLRRRETSRIRSWLSWKHSKEMKLKKPNRVSVKEKHSLSRELKSTGLRLRMLKNRLDILESK